MEPYIHDPRSDEQKNADDTRIANLARAILVSMQDGVSLSTVPRQIAEEIQANVQQQTRGYKKRIRGLEALMRECADEMVTQQQTMIRLREMLHNLYHQIHAQEVLNADTVDYLRAYGNPLVALNQNIAGAAHDDPNPRSEAELLTVYNDLMRPLYPPNGTTSRAEEVLLARALEKEANGQQPDTQRPLVFDVERYVQNPEEFPVQDADIDRAAARLGRPVVRYVVNQPAQRQPVRRQRPPSDSDEDAIPLNPTTNRNNDDDV